MIEIQYQPVEQRILDFLQKQNPSLHPEKLTLISDAYADFRPIGAGSLIWCSPTGLGLYEKLKANCSKLIVSLSGLPAGGKDTIRKLLTSQYPSLMTKVVTSTTRPKRPGEIEGVDYNFLTPEEFEKLIRAGDLVEYTIQAGDYYGLPAGNLTQALNRAPIAISHMEMSGWPRLKAKATHPIISLFVLPQLTYQDYLSWLESYRPKVKEAKVLRAQWELSVAQDRADALILNPINPHEPGVAAANCLGDWLRSFLV